MVTVFWDCKGVLLFDVLPRNVSITAEYYCSLLDKLKYALLEKRRRTCQQGNFNNFHLLHDNARPHVAAVTRKKLSDIGFTVLPHAPYSPDLSPCDYYLFSPLKASLNGKIFEFSEEITTHLQN